MWHTNNDNSGFIRSLIHLLIDKYVILYCLSWFLIRYTRSIGFPIPYINNWLTDFVFIPLIVHFALITGTYLFTPNDRFTFPLYQILILACYTSIAFEYLAPLYTIYNTADWGDVIAYFMGGLFFYYIHQPYTSERIKTLITRRSH